jgi:serine/threonine protein kinase
MIKKHPAIPRNSTMLVTDNKKERQFLDQIKLYNFQRDAYNAYVAQESGGGTGAVSDSSRPDQDHKKQSDQAISCKLDDVPKKVRQQMFEFSDFNIGLKIGQGAFAVVRRCTHKTTGHLVALKTYEKKNLTVQEAAQALHREIYILANLKHSNIMRLHEVIDNRTHVHLVMELCGGTSLFHHIKKIKPHPRFGE